MYVIIPLLLALAAMLGIAAVLLRKLSYLQKLHPESHSLGKSIAHDMFPELIDSIQRIRLKEYLNKMLVEIEKLLRKIRLLLSAIERLSDLLIRKIRQVHKKNANNQSSNENLHELATSPSQKTGISNIHTKIKRKKSADPTILKQQEQELIILIAKDPKNVELYGHLSDVYVRMGNLTDAQESLQTALKINPSNEDLAQKLTKVLEKVQRASGAKR